MTLKQRSIMILVGLGNTQGSILIERTGDSNKVNERQKIQKEIPVSVFALAMSSEQTTIN